MARFITFEGGDRSGKSTQAARLVRTLTARGVPAVLAREPGSTPLGERLRPLVLSGEVRPAPRAEALLFAAARAELVATLIRPALASGSWVVCDRFLDSSLAYQGAGLGLGIDPVRDLNLWATDGLLPDRTFLLDVPPDVRAARSPSPDAIDARGEDYHRVVAGAFRQLAAMEPERFVVVDGSLSPDTIEERIWKSVEELL